MEALLNRLEELLGSWGAVPPWPEIVSRTALGAGVALIALLVWIIASRVELKIIERIVRKTKAKWDDELFDKGMFGRIARFIPMAAVWFLAPVFLTGMPVLLSVVRTFAVLMMILWITLAVGSALNAVTALYNRREDSKRRPIKGLIQAVQVIIGVTAVILAFSVITKKPVSGLMAGLGAISAVLMLVFKDPLMGLVAGFQISSNDMVRIGDWIEVPSAGADGDVIDINLLNVTVRNFDKTYATFPIQELTATGFRNWRGMKDAGGRRIKRSLSLDLGSIRFADEYDLAKWRKIELIRDYLDDREEDIRRNNEELRADRVASPLNGRAMTNIGVFRAYAKAYVTSHPRVRGDMTLLVRQLQSGPEGLPLELYLFSRETDWAVYEELQADLFDHLFAALGEFGLRAFQAPSGGDLRELSQNR